MVEFVGGCALQPIYVTLHLKKWVLGSTNADFDADLKNDLSCGFGTPEACKITFEVWSFGVKFRERAQEAALDWLV